MIRRCVGTPAPGMLCCPRPATRWQVRTWLSGPALLNLCEEHYVATLDRSDVVSGGAY